MSALAYIKNFVADKAVASIAPSSQFAIRRVCNGLDFSMMNCVVEYGAGDGCFTRYILDRLPPHAKLLAFETNPSFVNYLRRKFDDRRLRVIHLSAERAADILERDGVWADCVISGIPFSLIEPEEREAIIANTEKLLAPHGTFVTYQVFPPSATSDSALRPLLEQSFALDQVEYEFRNLPPLRIYRARKPRHARQAMSAVPSPRESESRTRRVSAA